MTHTDQKGWEDTVRPPDEYQAELTKALDNPRLKWAFDWKVKGLLSRQLEEVRERAETIRRGPTLCGSCNLNGPLCDRCYDNRQFNMGLDTLLDNLKGK